MGTYSCRIATNQFTSVQLTIIGGPVNVSIASKTDDDKIIGEEDKALTIRCTAESEDPSPDMKLQINNQTFTINGTTTIQHTIQKTDRAYDGVLVKCLAGYDRYSDFMVDDSAIIYLTLKPLPPTFNSDPVVTKETSPLSVTCTSTGGRPKPTDISWTIEYIECLSISSLDVTSFSNTSSVYEPVSDTYTVTSTLIYNATRSDDGKMIFCVIQDSASRWYITSESEIKILCIPDTPTHFSVVDPTEHDLTVQWTPGDNGGLEQTFVIEYRESNTQDFHEAVIFNTSYTPHVSFLYHTLTQLSSRTTYDIRIFSRNSVGSSRKSKTVKMSTMCSSLSSTIGVAVGLSTVTIVSLIANGILTYRLLTGNKKTKKENPFVTPSNEISGPEVYYHAADDKDEIDDPNRTFNNACTDQPDLYDDIEETLNDQDDAIYSNSCIQP